MSDRHAQVRYLTSVEGSAAIARRRRRLGLAAAVGVAAVTASLLVVPLPSYASTTFVVTSTADLVDASPGDGLCASDEGSCTLRAAVQEANTSPVVDTVTVPAGTYRLTRPPEGGNEADTGDLDVIAPLVVLGAGAATTSVVGGPIPEGAPPEQLGMDRLLEITDTAGAVSLTGLTLRDGWSAEEGGAVSNASAGTVTFTDVVVADSDSQGEGGGIHQLQGALNLVDSTVSGNTARGGGGLYVAGQLNPNGVPARATLTRTTLSGNTADTGAGASVEHEGDLELRAATVSENHAHAHGGGVSVTAKATLSVTDGSLVENATNGDGGGLFASTEAPVTVTGTRFEGNRAGAEVDGEVPDGSGGGLASGGMGSLTLTDAVFTGNAASAEGGGAYLDNNGSVTFSDSQVTGNHAHAGAGIENAAARVTLRNLTITGNEADADGGGIESNGSGNFTIIDTTISGNTAENGGGIANAADGALRIEKTLIWDNRALQRTSDDTGLGGGVYSLGDAKALYENVTISGNIAQVRGGGIYVDADAPVVVTSTTIAHNSSPIASGVGGEIGSPNVPIQPSAGVILRNTIVADNELGPNCSFAVGSEGGNLEDGDSCYFRGSLDRSNAPTAGLDAVADRGGSTMTMGLTPDSLALDGGVTPCPSTDQRGVARPQNARCDSGAFESEGPFPAPDDTPPDTAFVAGPIQDTLTTSLFRFTGSDDVTATEDLRYECRLLESDPTEPPEPPDPTQPLPPELRFVGCGQPWQVPLIEDGFWTFEARAIDRAGNVDPTPFVHQFGGFADVIAPNTTILEKPSDPSTSSSATFTFSATDNATPVEFMEFECRIDTLDPAAWLECTNPAVYSNLAPGEHTFQVRATDAADNVDPSPASHTWTVGTPVDCDAANMTLTATADATVDEGTPLDNLGNLEALTVRSAAPGADARSLVQFDLPSGLPPCALESATLRLFGEGDDSRILLAVPAATAWVENTVVWNNQPASSGIPSTTTSGSGYREFDVTANVEAFDSGTPNHGWIVRDAVEEDATGAEQTFVSSEAVREPPTPPQLVLRFEPAGTPAPPAPPEPGATPTPVVCGQVVTESIRLANDLAGCMGEGLVVGAPDLVIDLDGHSISSGLVLDPGQEEGFFAGIRNSGHTNVVVRGGTVTGFGFGVRLMAGVTHNLVTDMTLRSNTSAGVELFDADNGRVGNTVRGNTLALNGDGVTLLGGSEGSTIVENTFSGNLGRAVYGFDASHHTIADNTVSGDTGDPLLDSDGGISLEASTDTAVSGNFLADIGDAAILVTAGSHRTVIEGNTTTRTSDSAVSVDDSDGVTVRGNTLHLAGGAAIGLGGSDDALVEDNDVRYNPSGIQLAGSHDAVIRSNDARQTQADGISLESSARNLVVGNLTNHTGGTGISVEGEVLDANGDPVDGNTIEDNEATGNLGDGISVGGAGHTVTANEAYNNGAWGISAAVGTIDGGGNLASGNAEPEQCTGVVCAPGSAPAPVAPDTTAPNTEITAAPANGSSALAPQTFAFTATDDQAPVTAMRFECRLDAPPDPEPEPPEPPEPGDPVEPPQPVDVDNWLPCGSPFSYQFLMSGEHTFEVRAIDPSDNVDLTPDVHTWTVVSAPPGPDDVAPDTTITSGPTDPSTSSDASFSFTGYDNATPGPYLTFECSVDGGAFTACTSPEELAGLEPGEHTFAVRALDAAGNEDESPATRTWTVEEPPADTTAPETTLDEHPDPLTIQTSATFAFSSPEDDVTFECRLDGAGYAACTSPTTLTVAPGEHTFDVRAVDAAGNEDDTPATWTWTVGAAPVPTAPTCGQVVTVSIVLTADLTDCGGDGLVVGAGGITIDLDGHVVDGTGLAAGIRVDGHDRVTVTGGSVREFDQGVALGSGTSGAIVHAMELRMNELAGVSLTNADDAAGGSTVRHTMTTANGVGILVEAGTQRAHVHHNTVTGNTGQGIHVLASGDNTIEDNTLSGSSDAGVELVGSVGNRLLRNSVSQAADTAVIVSEGSHQTVLEDNTLTDSEGGVAIELSDGARVVGNTVHNMSDAGVVLESADGALVRDNDLRFNAGGIELGGSSGNRVEANLASETAGTGIEVGDGSLRNVFIGNEANANDGAGIAVGAAAPAGEGNLVDGNTADDNATNGIEVTAVGHMIARNSANHNGGYGIYSALATVAGTNVDGGGNRASGNEGGGIDPETGLVIQCFNISCDGGAGTPSDTVAPDTSVIDGPSDPTTRTTATITFTGSDNATPVTFECRLDSTDAGAFAPCTSPVSFTGLAVGEHVFEVRATDWSGNVDQTPAQHAWTIQAPAPDQAPETTILTGPDATTVRTDATFTLDSDEEGVTFACSLDGGTAEPCTSPVSLTGLAVGSHELEVAATDVDGLTDPTPATWTWTVTAAPVATSVTCGQTITSSVRLTNDLTDCSGDGLVIGADAITVDLDGHTIDGVGLGAGVRNTGFDSVAVTGGTLTQFDDGILFAGGHGIVDAMTLTENQVSGVAIRGGPTGSVVRHTDVSSSPVGIELSGGTTGATVHDATLTLIPGDGVLLDGTTASTVTRTAVTGASQSGIALVGASGNTITDNTLSSNSGSGLSLDLASDDNTVRGNDVADSGSDGIAVTASDGNDVVANVVTTSGGCGISLDGATNTLVASNDVRFNAGGICLTLSSGNTIERNTVAGTSGTGISLEGESFDNVVRLNTVSGSSGSGIEVAGAAPAGDGNLVLGNYATGNSGDGIAVADGGHTVTDNVVTLNDGWGILAVTGTIDGGGNQASGNAEPAQCLVVVCTVTAAPGAPDTTIVDRPSDPSSSANALFTFTGSDNTTPTSALGFQCRLDSTDELDFVDCDNPWELTGLQPGEHTFEVRAIDETGIVDPTPATFTWTYVALPTGVAPDTFIDLAPPAASPLLDVYFTFSSNEPDVTYQCSLDGAAFTSCAFAAEYSFEETEVGSHTFRVRATDPEGNTDPTPATYTWTITGIVATVTGGPAFVPAEGTDPATGGETVDTTATFTFEANVADATFRCSIDGLAFTACTSPVTYTGLAIGDRLFQVYAIDPEGAEQIEATQYEWTIVSGLDTVPPDTQVTGGPADPTGSASFEFAGTDNVTSPQGLTFECSLDDPADAAFAECTSPWTYPNPDLPEPLAPGTHTFHVRAIDAEGNIDPTPATLEFTHAADTVAPTVAITALPATTTATAVTARFTANDPFATFECSLDGSLFEACTSPLPVTAEAAGPHTLAVRATDLVGNVGTASEATWTLLAAPETTLTVTPPAESVGPTATFEFTGSVVGTTFECTLDAGPWAACTSPMTLTGLVDGDHTFAVRGTADGFTDTTPAELTWTVTGAPADTEPPETVIDTGPPSVTTSTTATFTFSSPDPGAGYECRLDTAAFSACTSPLALTTVIEGEHVLEVRALDAAGNTDPTPASHTWTVDGPPEATVTSGPADLTESTTATFAFTSDEPGSTFSCWLDGAEVGCTSPKTYTGLSVGDHVFAVRATDAAGNVQVEWTEWEWTVTPAVAPVTTLTEAPTGTTTTTSATLAFTADEPGTFECSLDGAAFTACTSPVTLTGLDAGSHTFAVRAVDLAGNRDATPATTTWTVSLPDTSAPETTGTEGPSGTTTSTTATFAFGASETGSTFQCSLDGAAFAACTSPTSVSGLAVGPHTYDVRATDTSGNTDSTPYRWSWTVEAPPPSCTAGPVTLTANGDSWVDQGSPSSNKGTDSVLKVMSKSGGNLRALVRFQMPTVPAGCEVSTATLRLNAASARTGRTLQAFQLGGTWTESGVTWANQPATTGTPATTSSGTGWREWAVNGQVSAMLAAGGGHGFLVRDASENNDHEQQFRSRENGSNRPQLVITWATAGSGSGGGGSGGGGTPAPVCSTVTVDASADTWVDQSSPSQTKGTDSALKVRSKSGQNVRTLVAFPLPTVPAGCVVDSATLRLNAGSAAAGRTLQAFAAASSWTEGSASWANQPATTGSAVTTTSGTGWREWGVGGIVRSMYSAGGGSGFLVRDSAEGANAEQSFHSRESGSDLAPELVVRFVPAP